MSVVPHGLGHAFSALNPGGSGTGVSIPAVHDYGSDVSRAHMTCRYPDRRGFYAVGCKRGGCHCRDVGNNESEVWPRFRLALNTASHRCCSESSGRRDTPIDFSKSEGHLCEFSPIPQRGLRIEDNNVLFFIVGADPMIRTADSEGAK